MKIDFDPPDQQERKDHAFDIFPYEEIQKHDYTIKVNHEIRLIELQLERDKFVFYKLESIGQGIVCFSMILLIAYIFYRIARDLHG